MKLNPLKISLILFLIFSIQLSAQSKEDYCAEWRKISDTISNYENYINHNSSMLNMVDLKCKVDILIRNGIAFERLRKDDSAIANYSKAISIGKELNLTKELIRVYTKMPRSLIQKDRTEEAIEMLKEAKKALIKYPEHEDWNLYYETQAFLSDVNSDYDEAVVFMDSSIVFSKRIKSNEFLQFAYFNKGTYLTRKSDYESAAISYLNGIELVEKSGSPDNLETCYYLLGNCYRSLEQHETALKYYHKAKKAARKASNSHALMISYSKMSISQLALGLIDEVMASTDSVVVLAKRLNSNGILGSAYNRKAEAYFKYIKDYEQAELYYTKSYETSLQANSGKKTDELLKFSAVKGMFIMYMHKKNYKKAKVFLDLLEKEVGKSGLLMYKKTFNEYSSNYYEAIGQHAKAIKYLRTEYKIKDSISNDKVKTQVAKLEKQYNTASKELEIVKLNEQKTEQEQIATKAKAKQNLYMLTAIVLLSFLIAGYWLFRKLKKQKEELASTNKVKNRLFSIIAHDIRGMIIPFQRSGKMLTHYIEEKNYDKTVMFSQELQKNATGLSNMLDNLLSWSLEQMNGYKMHPELLYLSKELEDIKSNFLQQAEFKKTKIDIVYKEDVALTIDKGSFHIIYRNLIGNALKYTENGIIRIEFNRDFKTLKSTITDTGIGMSQEQLKDLFSLDTKSSSVGTKGEKGTGLGLSLVQRFVTMNTGTIEVSSEKRVGTKFNLNFQLSAQDIIETENINKKEQSA